MNPPRRFILTSLPSLHSLRTERMGALHFHVDEAYCDLLSIGLSVNSHDAFAFQDASASSFCFNNFCIKAMTQFNLVSRGVRMALVRNTSDSPPLICAVNQFNSLEEGQSYDPATLQSLNSWMGPPGHLCQTKEDHETQFPN